MHWLNVPYIQQSEVGWCLPACAAMVAAYWQQPILQADLAHWLGAQGIGVASSRLVRLNQRGFQVVYGAGSLVELQGGLAQNVPCILFVCTGELPYWRADTPHAVALVGLEGEQAHLLDPAVVQSPVSVSVGDLLLAWSHSDYTYAVLRPAA